MIEFYYVNSKNEKIDFTHFPYMVESISDLLDYEFNFSQTNEKITKIYQNIVRRSFFVNVHGNTIAEYYEAINRLYDIAQYDIENGVKGKLFYKNQYLNCNLIASKKSGWSKASRYHLTQLTLITDNPKWIRESLYYFDAAESTSSNNKHYPGRYVYRYVNGVNSSYLVNPSNTASHFKMIIGGPVINPSVTIGKNTYLIYITLGEGEQLEIDSAAGTVYKITKYGGRVNAFHNRQKSKTFFSKIASGIQDVKIPLGVSVNLTLFEERSEPKW